MYPASPAGNPSGPIRYAATTARRTLPQAWGRPNRSRPKRNAAEYS